MGSPSDEKRDSRTLWQRLTRARTPEVVQADVQRTLGAIDKVLVREHETFANTTRDLDALEASRPREANLGTLERFDSICELMRDETRVLRDRSGLARGAKPGDALRATCERIEAHAAELEAEVDRLSKRADLEKNNAEEWRRRAMLGVAAGDDTIARESLERAKEADALALTILRERDTAARVLEELRVALAG